MVGAVTNRVYKFALFERSTRSLDLPACSSSDFQLPFLLFPFEFDWRRFWALRPAQRRLLSRDLPLANARRVDAETACSQRRRLV